MVKGRKGVENEGMGIDKGKKGDIARQGEEKIELRAHRAGVAMMRIIYR